ncbi:cupin domain-containing protein [Haloferacaceae archaeon DSL9]
MDQPIDRLRLEDAQTNDDKPGDRWELSPELGLSAYNYNVALLEAGERLSQNAYHYHENQEEFFHVLDGRCRAEVDDDSFDLAADEFVRFGPGVPHLIHNPYDAPCKLVAIGSPPDGRYPVHQVQSYEELLAERYPDGLE